MWKTIVSCFLINFSNVSPFPISNKFIIEQYKNNSAVKLLQEYIQIDTSRGDVELAVNFWKREADILGLPFAVHRPSNKPICVITWPGTNPGLPSIILNSHMDVVSVLEQQWTYPPFAGYIDDNGDLYGRGTQDTKALSINYLEAIRKLKNDEIKLQRTIHILLMPDEETGSYNGMIPFLETEEFKALNPGFFLDEGVTSSDDILYATYEDKRPWQFNLTIYGEGGHGSLIQNDTAMEKVQRLFDTTMLFRQQQKQIMLSREATDFGSYTTLNINMVKGGVAPNIIPSVVNVVVDMRLATSVQANEMDELINFWIGQMGNGTELSYLRKIENSAATVLDNPYWSAFEDAVNEMGLKVVPVVCPATTDMMFVRNYNYPAIGFAYRPYTIVRIHAADEYLNIATFLQGTEVYANILKKLGNVP